ncbi:MAG: hypothetical protein J5J00_11330 [Deltaproteobacteria bacterium]|nr:hypothetical protein [Deltaproteobacteria bacterium]
MKIIAKHLSFLAAVILMAFPACSTAADKAPISSYEECVKAGYPIMKSFPARCAVPGGKVFTQEIKPDPSGKIDLHPPVAQPPPAGSICKDLCGDGTCQEIVCMGQGCPCSESAESCPADCGK